MASRHRVHGVCQQLALLIEAPTATRLIACSVRVREAGAFAQLAALEFPGGVAARGVRNSGPVEKMARASDLLVLLQSGLLPHLRRFPTHAVVLMITEACTKLLRAEGREAGGSFHQETAALVDNMNAYFISACTHVQYSSFGALFDQIDHLQHRVEKFLNSNRTLSWGGGGAAAEDAQVAGAAEEKAQAAGAAAAKAGSHLHVDGVRHLLVKCASANDEHHLLRAPVVVSSVRVREAGAFAQLAALGARHIVNGGPLQRIARTSELLILLHSAIFPYLQQYPLNDFVLDVLERCAEVMRVQGREAGGSFHKEIIDLGDRIGGFLVEARNHFPNSALHDSIYERIKLILDKTCTLTQAAGAAAAAAEAEGAAQA